MLPDVFVKSGVNVLLTITLYISNFFCAKVVVSNTTFDKFKKKRKVTCLLPDVFVKSGVNVLLTITLYISNFFCAKVVVPNTTFDKIFKKEVNYGKK